eukprot:TRINITY_DN50849_c0_g1_i1.p1 TRINITY_DN50849_c0_g1~~TRINITY_DN50849_c0_g1_i1.p1  ORF type:complete len:405 (+),score=71.39 TRINITY_DN50849_c0_g1_i1:172-1386(+)
MRLDWPHFPRRVALPVWWRPQPRPAAPPLKRRAAAAGPDAGRGGTAKGGLEHITDASLCSFLTSMYKRVPAAQPRQKVILREAGWKKALDIFNAHHAQGVAGEASAVCMAEILSNARQNNALKDFTSRHFVGPDPHPVGVYCALLQVHSMEDMQTCCSLYASAVQRFRDRRGTHPPPRLQLAMANAYLRRNLIEESRCLVEQIRNPGEIPEGYQLIRIKLARSVEEAEGLLPQGVQVRSTHLVALLKVCQRFKDLDSAERICKKYSSAVTPDIRQRLFQVLCVAEPLRAVCKTAEALSRDGGRVPDPDALESLRTCRDNAESSPEFSKHADVIFEQLFMKGRARGPVPWELLAETYRRSGRESHVSLLSARMAAAGVVQRPRFHGESTRQSSGNLPKDALLGYH